jgi:hypothetical protein
MNINDYRIREAALDGFIIEKKIFTEKITGMLWWKKKNISAKWVRIDSRGFQPIYIDFVHEWLSKPIKPFKTKQEAIDFLEKICTPNKFYYPTDFK